jgi:hypothetical protein
VSEIVQFPRRLYDADALSLWAITTENAALSRRGSMPTLRAKCMADQIADLCRALRHEVETNTTPPKGGA